MLGVGSATRIYLAAGATDMRKGFEGLHGLVRDRLGNELSDAGVRSRPRPARLGNPATAAS
jgi:transposase